MRKSPINYLISFACAAVLWVILGIFIGDLIGESITLATLAVEEFLNLFRIALGVITLLSLILIFYWLYYGAKSSTAGELKTAKKKYIVLFVTELIFAIIMLVILVIMLLDEGVVGSDYALIFLLAIVQTFILFWVTTLFFSPKTVKYIPFLAKKIF